MRAVSAADHKARGPCLADTPMGEVACGRESGFALGETAGDCCCLLWPWSDEDVAWNLPSRVRNQMVNCSAAGR